jgi:hypothetical protein
MKCIGMLTLSTFLLVACAGDPAHDTTAFDDDDTSENSVLDDTGQDGREEDDPFDSRLEDLDRALADETPL